MKLMNQKFHLNIFMAVFSVLTLLMLATRTHHFSNFNHLPSASIAFFTSNGDYYTLSGKFAELSWAEYETRVDKYYFKSVSNPVFYIISAIVIDFTINHLFTNKELNTSVIANHKH
ncbi:hypothetical protein Q4530_03505 [Colwellia sp. 1_MG-2023]|uniref:hypothetical protein n=1 Tax=unclassified Colwellia TaxID=196834 RepID=UPI001C090340|nr:MULTISPECIES: hypothetical protein [unclassified Colwellia]MBU2923547.1 hypothetical protein [Colwellia sp. C2M11]MDO6486115.1 hypothetical protein [Colwellia sp. 6_MG-2023]MDO6653278.1 hypothetical protein [Colwellia sp. 3_MG-2023]MDO6664477.1 hypothetical protein [Colwellia sp. 2_MG-2023]MDO6688828.1 hypothetical protein [Colwellia sp. 1_MG-2023]